MQQETDGPECPAESQCQTDTRFSNLHAHYGSPKGTLGEKKVVKIVF